jgi:hypothetical protein
MLILVVVAAEL